jgi:guanylate kinase
MMRRAKQMKETSKSVDPYHREQPPLLIVISGPPGVGKDSVVRRMKERGFPVHFVVTATDRPPRPDEVHGRDYYFYTTAEFECMIAEGELLEYACVYGQYKGIPKAHVREALASGQDVVMRLDVQGAATVKKLIQAAVTIFLTCESEEELVARLRERHTESEAALQRRLASVRGEIACIPDFDYMVVNSHNALDVAVDDILAIIRAEHCRSMPQRIRL